MSHAIGDTFANGIDGLLSHSFDWSEQLTVIARHEPTYACERYVVANAAGRRGYAY